MKENADKLLTKSQGVLDTMVLNYSAVSLHVRLSSAGVSVIVNHHNFLIECPNNNIYKKTIHEFFL